MAKSKSAEIRVTETERENSPTRKKEFLSFFLD
jgi:hypothetical protein